ncbi:MAG: hypothetical protein ACK5Y2_11650 [Bdellovibrionales bacterium]
MAFEELREQFISRLKDLGHRIQETPAYQNFKERFEDLPPSQQTFLAIFTAVVLGGFVLSFPLSSISDSMASVEEFEERRDLIRELFKVTQETQDSLSLPAPPSMDQIKSGLEMQLQQFQLIPAQIAGINIEPSRDGLLISRAQQDGIVRVILKKLNLRQVATIVPQLQRFHPAVKLSELFVDSNPEDPRYLDTTLDFIIVKVPQIQMTPEEPEPEPARRRGRRQ